MLRNTAGILRDPNYQAGNIGKGKSGKSSNFTGDTDVDGNLDAPDVDISGAVDLEEKYGTVYIFNKGAAC